MIGQFHAKRVLSVAVHNHYKRLEPRRQEQRRRAREVEHPAGRPHGLRQDAARADAGAHPRRAVHHGRRHDAHGSRLCRRGRREHHPQAPAERRLQRRARTARHRLHRRDRQDQPQVGQSVDHARCIGRGRAAGAAQDHGRHGRVRSAAGWPQASAAGIPAGRHLEHPVHLRRRVRGSRKDHRPARQGHVDRLRREGDGARRAAHRRAAARGGARGSAEVRPDPRNSSVACRSSRRSRISTKRRSCRS